MNTILIAISIITGLGFICGFILGFAAFLFKIKDDPIIEKIDYVLPQSQCGQCGYPGCYLYAKAIAKHNAAINKCSPGGESTMLKISELLNVEPQRLDKDKLILDFKIAFIDEVNCIGCTKCIHICPVDAIIGTIRTIHTVIEDFCTGCNLCVNACPTHCITMLPAKTAIKHWKWNLTGIPTRSFTKL